MKKQDKNMAAISINTTQSYKKITMGKIKHIHFVGIGGAGMSGIAELLHNIGYLVTGSDMQSSKVTDYLTALNISVFLSHDKKNCNDADVVVRSTAIAASNVEIIAAKKKRIPVIDRAEMLAELMRFRYGIAVAGTHGKTTTTSLVASVLAQANLDPTFIIGGKLNSAGTNAKLGSGPYLVAEADESDASFLHLQPMIAAVTNLEEDHMDTYEGDFNKLRDTFLDFIHQLPFYGLAIICADDENLSQLQGSISRRIIRYAIQQENVDFRAYDIEQSENKTSFKVAYFDEASQEKRSMNVLLNMPGKHNVLNALVAIAVAKELDIDDKSIQVALKEFQGIGRRFQIYGEKPLAQNAGSVLVIDDYAHHPSELKATITAVKAGWKNRRLVVLFQPHRFSRTRDLYEDFIHVLSSVDHLLLLNVYPAGEKAIAGADSRCMTRSIRSFGKIEPILIHKKEQLSTILAQQLKDGDILLSMGAGDIGNMIASIVLEN